jgi:hypothetical protein
LLLGGLAAAALVVHACALALRSHDNKWGVARALLQGVDPYKAYVGCAAACRQTLFVPPVDPMYPPTRPPAWFFCGLRDAPLAVGKDCLGGSEPCLRRQSHDRASAALAAARRLALDCVRRRDIVRQCAVSR